MPGPYDELEKEAERLEKQSKNEFGKKNFLSAISLLNEAKDIYLDASPLGTTGPYLGTSVSGWWEQMKRYSDTFNFNLVACSHTLKFRHLYGDGTLWDYIKLERL